MKWKTAILVTAAGSLIASSALAGARAEGARKAKKRARILAKFDANQNGLLDPQEKQALKKARKARKAKRLARWLARRDVNRDGVLSWDEVAPDRPDRVQRARQRFQRLDANQDGVVDKQEIKRAAKWLAKKKHEARKARRAPGAAPPAAPVP